MDIFNPIGDELRTTIYLYLPSKLSESYRSKYAGVELGAVGAAMVGAARDLIKDKGEIGEGFAEQVKAFASAAKPAIGYNAGAGLISQVVSKTTGGSGSLDAKGLTQLTSNRIFNPYEEALFQGTDFRDHQFDFKMAPKDSSDVQTIYQIIQTLRVAMLPGKDGDNWLTIPDYFRMSIMRYKSNGYEETISDPKESGGQLAQIMRFPTNLVLTDMAVDLAPDGNYASLQTHMGDSDADFGPVSYNMRLAFKETSYLTKESFGDDVTLGGRYNYNNAFKPTSKGNPSAKTTPPADKTQPANPPSSQNS